VLISAGGVHPRTRDILRRRSQNYAGYLTLVHFRQVGVVGGGTPANDSDLREPAQNRRRRCSTCPAR